MKEENEVEEAIPEYIECIANVESYFKVGYIYKVKESEDLRSSAVVCNLPIDSFQPHNTLWVTLVKNGQKFYRPSTKEAFEAQVKSKKSAHTAVHLPTQEKWNFFIGKWNPMKLTENDWNDYEKRSCINLSEGRYGDYEYYTKESYKIISFEQWCEDNGYTVIETKTKAKDKKVEMKPDYSNYPKVSFEELQIGSKFVNIKYNTDIRTVTAKTVDNIHYSDSDGKNQELYKEYWYLLDCRLISHPTSECKVIPEPEVLEMVPIDKYFKIRN